MSITYGICLIFYIEQAYELSLFDIEFKISGVERIRMKALDFESHKLIVDFCNMSRVGQQHCRANRS